MLSQQYLEFGQKARDFYVKHGLMSKAADAWAKKMGTGWEKAPVQVCACVYVRVFARVRVYVRVCECVCAQKRGKTCCCVPVFEEMTFLVRSSVKLNVCDSAGTAYHGEPREKATLLARGLLPFAEEDMPATPVHTAHALATLESIMRVRGPRLYL